MLRSMVIILMGVTGSGKTTVGEALAASIGCEFFDADSFHSAANKAKMSSGIALTDDDRWPWLAAIRARIDTLFGAGEIGVFGCSALKDTYRRALGEDDPRVRFVYLHGSEALLAERLRNRVGHFMNPALLASQIATLEVPANAVRIDVALPLAAQVREIRRVLSLDDGDRQDFGSSNRA
jgi:gluconokinase